MKKNSILAIAFIIGLVLAWLALIRPMTIYRLLHPTSRREVIEQVFKGQEIFEVITNSPQVTAQQLYEKSDTDPELLSGYTRGAPVTLTPDQARQIKSLLQSPWSYLWDVSRTCLPHYGVVYNFKSGGHSVHVAFCLKCNIIGIFDGDNDASKSISFSFLFDPMRAPIVTLTKTLLPNDQELQALK